MSSYSEVVEYLAEPRRLGAFVEEGDHVGLTFSVASGIMLISTAFFFFQATKVPAKWRTSMFVIGCVCGTAFWHYLYLRDLWSDQKHVLPVYRYVDWFLTVPMQVIEFYLILKASCGASATLFWKFFFSSMIMLIAGYLGETKVINVWMAFFVGCIAWLFIIWEVFMGESSQVNERAPVSAQKAFRSLRTIVSVGWSLYPIGYAVGNGSGDSEAAEDALNGIYNLADLVNKTAFGLVLFIAATSDQKVEQFQLADEKQQEKSRQAALQDVQQQLAAIMSGTPNGMLTPGMMMGMPGNTVKPMAGGNTLKPGQNMAMMAGAGNVNNMQAEKLRQLGFATGDSAQMARMQPNNAPSNAQQQQLMQSQSTLAESRQGNMAVSQRQMSNQPSEMMEGNGNGMYPEAMVDASEVNVDIVARETSPHGNVSRSVSRHGSQLGLVETDREVTAYEGANY